MKVDFKPKIYDWVANHSPNLEKRAPMQAVELALKKSQFVFNILEIGKTKELIIDDEFEELMFWAKLGIGVKLRYKFLSNSDYAVYSYPLNNAMSLDHWIPFIEIEDDLQMRLLFGEPIESVFQSWKNKMIPRLENQYKKQFDILANSFQGELDTVLSQIINESKQEFGYR